MNCQEDKRACLPRLSVSLRLERGRERSPGPAGTGRGSPRAPPGRGAAAWQPRTCHVVISQVDWPRIVRTTVGSLQGSGEKEHGGSCARVIGSQGGRGL